MSESVKNASQFGLLEFITFAVATGSSVSTLLVYLLRNKMEVMGIVIWVLMVVTGHAVCFQIALHNQPKFKDKSLRVWFLYLVMCLSPAVFSSQVLAHFLENQ